MHGEAEVTRTRKTHSLNATSDLRRDMSKLIMCSVQQQARDHGSTAHTSELLGWEAIWLLEELIFYHNHPSRFSPPGPI